MKLMPAARPLAMMRSLVSASVRPPNIIVPRQIGETLRPLRPSRRYSIVFLRTEAELFRLNAFPSPLRKPESGTPCSALRRARSRGPVAEQAVGKFDLTDASA